MGTLLISSNRKGVLLVIIRWFTMCLGCAVYTSNAESYEKASAEKNNEDYNSKTYGE